MDAYQVTRIVADEPSENTDDVVERHQLRSKVGDLLASAATMDGFHSLDIAFGLEHITIKRLNL